MTRLDLRNLVLYWVDDLQGTYFTPAQVNTWINNAQMEIQKYLLQAGENYYYKCQETTLVVNQQDYTLPDDFYDILRVEVVLSGTGVTEEKRQLSKITLNQQNLVNITQTSDPRWYVLTKDKLKLFPIPGTAKILRLYYSYLIEEMTQDTDVPDIPVEFQEGIAVIAAWNAFIKDDRVPSNLKQKYDDYMKLLKETSEDRAQDNARVVIQTTDYGPGVLF